jgi:MFS family permease
MSATLDLKTAERKAFQLSTSQDGLYDIFLGLYIILQSAEPWLDENGLRTPWNVILVLALGLLILLGVLLVKKFMVAPRIGRVRYGPERKRRMKRLAIAMVIIFLLTLALFGMTVSAIYFREPIFSGPVEWSFPLDIVHTAAAIFIFAIFSLIGYMNDYVRLYFYGFLFGLGYIVSTTLQDINGTLFYWPWAVAGLIAVVTGLVLFVRFLRDYPLQLEPVLEGNH